MNPPCASLDAQPTLGLVLPWLRARELCRLRGISRRCRAIVPLQTWQLSTSDVEDPAALEGLLDAFPNTRRVSWAQILTPAEPLTRVVGGFGRWQLRSLELSQVWNLTDAHLRLVTTACPLLERLVVSQCYLLKAPSIVAPRLRMLVLENCLLIEFAEDSTWPELTELRVSSRVLASIPVRTLIKKLLVESRLEVLDLSDCFMIEQLLLDPGDLPQLRTLALRSCLGLKRVHISSRTVRSVDLALCVELEYLILDLGITRRLDLSYLQRLSHLFIRSSSLGLLDLRSCGDLNRTSTHIHCPSIVVAHLQGTRLTDADLTQRPETES